MKKASLTMLIILCLLSMSLLRGYKASVKADTNIKYVSPGETIQAAINNATDGYTIFVREGTYHEHVVVNKSLSLIGENMKSTIIDGSKTGSVVNLRADNVVLKGFTINNSGIDLDDSGVRIDSSNNIISSNTLMNNYNGISLYLSLSSNNIILNNLVLNNSNGVYLFSSIDNVISNNSILSNLQGIYMYDSRDNLISSNTISLNTFYGMYLTSTSSNNTIYHNNFNNTDEMRIEAKNIWNYSDDGNYWSSYKGQDLNEDGIGDNAVAINDDNKDYYPLMGTFSEFSVDWQGKSYNFAFISNSTLSNFRFKVGLETGNKITYFDVTGGNNTVGFCRTAIPTELMNYTFIVLIDEKEELIQKLLDSPDEKIAYLYFTYSHSNHTIEIISSKTLSLYNELLEEYNKAKIDFYDLNMTYYALLYNYSMLLGNYTDLNSSYQKHLLEYSQNMDNIRNLMYVIATVTGIFIITTIYLSKKAHSNVSPRMRIH